MWRHLLRSLTEEFRKQPSCEAMGGNLLFYLICSIRWPVCNDLMHLKVTSDVESGLHLLHRAGRSGRDNSGYMVKPRAGVPKTTSPLRPALHHHGSYPLGVDMEDTPVPTLSIFLASFLSVITHRVFISPETPTCLRLLCYCLEV